jgi:hypothetical protein
MCGTDGTCKLDSEGNGFCSYDKSAKGPYYDPKMGQ